MSGNRPVFAEKPLKSGHQLPVNQLQSANPACSVFFSGSAVQMTGHLPLESDWKR